MKTALRRLNLTLLAVLTAAAFPVMASTTLHFHGNTHEAPPCTGNGSSDFIACGGPFLFASGTLDPAPAAHFDYNALSGKNGTGPYDANWTWKPAVPTTVSGYTVVQWWASCNAACTVLGGTWHISLYKNNTTLVTEFLVDATPAVPNVPSLLSAGITLAAPIDLNGVTDTLTLKLEENFSDTGAGSSIFYDSSAPCPGASGVCDSTVEFNATAPPPPPPPPPPGLPSGLPPRHQVHVSPPGLGNDAGEPSIGFNKFTKNAMFISFTQALRMIFQENALPALPVACDAQWLDKSGNITTANSLDPILFTDEATGRTFNSQLSGANSLFEFTDDDGENWTTGQIGAPNGGADHQTVASGVYPTGSVPATASWPPAGLKRAVYYCSQSVAGAFCSRSDDGGSTFGPGFALKNPDCSAGALHGHVKVAPDGTVYVPDASQCVLPLGGSAEKVIAFVSADAGATWAARPIPQSTGGAGSDPSIGIATDGTIYECYENGDSHVHCAVSHDRGLTWINDTDIGLADQIVHGEFPQTIAGDPDRAACAFLGTRTAGDSESLDFPGVWYPYVATTYDGGVTWHLVNVSPDDPVQGRGGIGPDGTNRNLLDFNDLQMDDQGRTLFAFADGCIGGCVKDPSKNSFASKATVVRQTGGRTLLSAYDNAPGTQFNSVSPIKPAPACASQTLSIRTVAQARLVWNAPDNGGSPVTNYKVYRSTTSGGTYDFIGDAGADTQFTDWTGSPSQPEYYYRVVAENAQGAASISNTIVLPISVAPPPIDTCTLPGEVIAVDAIGDGVTDDTDIVSVAVAEPKAYAGNLVITLKLANFTAGQPPAGSFYPILFPTEGNKYISLDLTQGPAKFTYGTYADVANGVLAFTEGGLLDPRSAFAPDGTVQMVVPKTLFGNPGPGSVLAGFDARARLGSQSATSRDTAGPADYTIRGTAICDAPAVVLAALDAAPQIGTAPLPVTLTVSGTPPAGNTLQSFTLIFGDGQSVANQSFSGQASVQVLHTYQNPGTYRARLTVTDSQGNMSSNLSERTIEVSAVPPTLSSVSPVCGTVAGGTSVSLTGTGFRNGMTVSFGTGTVVASVSSGTTATATTPAHGRATTDVTVTNDDTAAATKAQAFTFVYRGDANGDCTVDPGDIFYLINNLFQGGPQPVGSGDANGDHTVEPGDIFYLVNFLFMNGPAPE